MVSLTLRRETARIVNGAKENRNDRVGGRSLTAGDTFSLTLGVPGDYTYLCIFHEALGMVGHLTVLPAAGD